MRRVVSSYSLLPLATHGGERHKSPEQGSIRSLLRHGETATYLVRRLKRDTPAIAEALGRGEYRSGRAAAVAAGFVKKVRRVPCDLLRTRAYVDCMENAEDVRRAEMVTVSEAATRLRVTPATIYTLAAAVDP